MFDQDTVQARQEREFSESIKHYTMEDFRALHDLMLLLEENSDTNDSTNTNPEPMPDTLFQLPSTLITNTVPSVTNKFKPKSRRFLDLAMNSYVWAFLVEVVSDIKQMQITSYPSNLTSAQRTAIFKLSELPDLIIKASDKGGNVVLMTKPHYEKMCFAIHSNKNWYRTIPASFIPTFKAKYLTIINDGYQRSLIDQDTYDYLNNKYPREATFYSFPKVHKNSTPPGLTRKKPTTPVI